MRPRRGLSKPFKKRLHERPALLGEDALGDGDAVVKGAESREIYHASRRAEAGIVRAYNEPIDAAV